MIDDEDLKYLKEAGCAENVIRHCIAVTEKALEIAKMVNVPVDKELIKKGGINHDIGRSVTHGIDHAVAGAGIAKSMGLREEVVRIIERHIGAGITRDEAISLGLPPKDYIPETPEEIIVAYADNLAKGDVMGEFDEALMSFSERLGDGHPAVERFIKMHKLIQTWINKRSE
ncbi:tRNA 2'-O-methylase [bacterium BMS3Bbin05]|nr:tRNA 2'-O-methylase [bacterium BMS3Bbin05]